MWIKSTKAGIFIGQNYLNDSIESCLASIYLGKNIQNNILKHL
jgi:hypothetical protein